LSYPDGQTIHSIYFVNPTIGYAVSSVNSTIEGSILKTTDAGQTWTVVANELYCNLYSVYFENINTGWAVGCNDYNPESMYKTTNGGLTWTAQSSGTTGVLKQICFTSNSTGFIVGSNNAILKLPNPSGINDFVEIPKQSMLIQNYPNPFNNSTNISFDLPKDDLVNLSVYNAKGELVKTLVSGNQSAGMQSVTFDANGLNSGVYYYKLQTGDNAMTKKMLLVK